MDGRLNSLSTHFQTAPYHKATLQLSIAFRLPCLGVEALQLRLHILVCERYSGVNQAANLEIRFVSLRCAFECESI